MIQFLIRRFTEMENQQFYESGNTQEQVQMEQPHNRKIHYKNNVKNRECRFNSTIA
jgi:hypothetical protein